MTRSREILKPRFKWTAEALALLAARYPHEKTAGIAADLGCSVSAAYNQAKALQLRKSPEFFASEESGRTQPGSTRGVAGRFTPGQAAWNKGTHFVAGGRSAETRFKPGNKPHKTQPIGSFRITKDGTLQRKVTEDKGNNSKRWRSVHELVWIEANGAVPAGHIVVFKPGMRTQKLDEITLDKVECISFAENMRRNTIHRMPKELADVMRLKGAVQRQINKRTRHEKQH